MFTDVNKIWIDSWKISLIKPTAKFWVWLVKVEKNLIFDFVVAQAHGIPCWTVVCEWTTATSGCNRYHLWAKVFFFSEGESKIIKNETINCFPRSFSFCSKVTHVISIFRASCKNCTCWLNGLQYTISFLRFCKQVSLFRCILKIQLRNSYRARTPHEAKDSKWLSSARYLQWPWVLGFKLKNVA